MFIRPNLGRVAFVLTLVSMFGLCAGHKKGKTQDQHRRVQDGKKGWAGMPSEKTASPTSPDRNLNLLLTANSNAKGLEKAGDLWAALVASRGAIGKYNNQPASSKDDRCPPVLKLHENRISRLGPKFGFGSSEE